MKSGRRDQVEGTAKKMKGDLQRKQGKATGDPDKAAAGSVEQTGARFQKKSGEIKRDILRE